MDGTFLQYTTCPLTFFKSISFKVVLLAFSLGCLPNWNKEDYSLSVPSYSKNDNAQNCTAVMRDNCIFYYNDYNNIKQFGILSSHHKYRCFSFLKLKEFQVASLQSTVSLQTLIHTISYNFGYKNCGLFQTSRLSKYIMYF